MMMTDGMWDVFRGMVFNLFLFNKNAYKVHNVDVIIKKISSVVTTYSSQIEFL